MITSTSSCYMHDLFTIFSMEHSKPTNEADADKSFENWPPELEHLSLSLSSASQVASNIDVLIEILKRLPVKTILRFKSVSKHWLSLMSDSHFSYKHFNHHNINPRLSAAGLFLLEHSSCRNAEFFFLDRRILPSGSGAIDPFESLNFLNSFMPEMKILQSCNGLLLCQTGSFHPNNLNYHIYNPYTKQFKTLSSLPRSPFNSSTAISVSLAFDPLKSFHYKITWIWKEGKPNEASDCFQMHIYSSETDTWRRPENSIFDSPKYFDQNSGVYWYWTCEDDPRRENSIFDLPKYFDQNSGVYWNGSLNWTANYLADADYSYCYIIDQDLVKRVPLPPVTDIRHPKEKLYFGECSGHLYFILIDDPALRTFHIFEMEMDFSTWNVKYCVSLEALQTAVLEMFPHLTGGYFFLNPRFFAGIRILHVMEEEEDNLKLVIQVLYGKVFSYNIKEMNFQEIHCLGQKFIGGLVIVYQFIESCLILN